MMKRRVIIGIDPDVDKSGLAVVSLPEREIALYDFTLPQMVDFFREMKANCDSEDVSYVVIVEASYLIQTNWHLSWNDSKSRAAAKGKQVGRNHEIGRQIVAFCKHLHIPYEEKRPLTKCWSGKDGKITADELNLLLEGTGFAPITSKTNQEKRDAALLALDYSNLPMRMARKQR